jgi:putative addiction module component (TIGR02574 family)
MATKLQAIEAQVMRLGPKSRAKLAERLILSLDIPVEAELEHLWAEEAERRVDELRKGQVTARPAAAVLRKLRRQISRKRSRSTP